ncbi:MAG: hypothetical protein K6E77_08570 [Lachnospiraceae bacterium]|nr:hypothetical protein [Lachnospiraceae bacterium]
MKRKLSVLLATAVVVAGVLAGCGGSAAPASSKAASSAAPAASSAAPAATSSAAASSAAAQVLEVPVTFENKCGVDLKELYLSGAGRDDWGDNLLGSGLKDKESAKGTLLIDAANVKWDIKAVDGNGDSVEFQGLDLSECSTSGVTMTLSFDGSNFVVSAK